MCGIAGILSFDGAPIDERRLRVMRDAIGHRGPDGQGLWANGLVGFGHCRLAIVDLGGGAQPMTNAGETTWLTYNGEVYNHADIRADLETRGRRYRTRSDTETIIQLYDEYGLEGLDRLRGMFAFGLWDSVGRRLVLMRDRLGIKPLYYVAGDRELAFASEIKALVAGGAVRPALNDNVLDEWLAMRTVSAGATLFKDVREVPPGHWLTWSRETGVVIQPYWWTRPLPAAHRMSLADAAAELREQLRNAVRRHLMSDVPLGVFLSGGLDSSALAALAAREMSQPVQTFSVGVDDRDADERPFAELAARHIGAVHREVVVTPARSFEALPRLIWHQDGPLAFPSGVMLNFVSELARDHVKVVLTGEGADELFLGYNRYRVTEWNRRLGAPYWKLVPAGVRAGIRRAIQRAPQRIARMAGRTFLAHESGSRSLYFENFATFSSAWRQALLDRRRVAARDPFDHAIGFYRSGAGDRCDRMSRADLHTYLPELLMKQDRMSMAASIESRVPFLDDTLVEHVIALPSRLKLRGWQTKAVLREAVRDLVPAQVLRRPKMGFPMPVGRWLRGQAAPMLDEFVLGARTAARGIFRTAGLRRLVGEHLAGQADHGDRLWLLMNLEMWQRLFCDGEDSADIARFIRSVISGHAHSVGQDGRAVAVEHRRPAAHLPDPVGSR